MEYSVLNNKKEWKSGEYSLTPIRERDIFCIKNWRNEQIDVLRQAKPLSDSDQITYYQDVVLPLFSQVRPEQLLFSFLYDGECIGYGGLVHIDWSKKWAEVSFLVDSVRACHAEVYKNDFTVFLSLIKYIAFHELRLEKLTGETYDIRSLHISILEANGFVLEKRMKNAREIKGRLVDSLFHGCYPTHYECEDL